MREKKKLRIKKIMSVEILTILMWYFYMKCSKYGEYDLYQSNGGR